MSFFFFSLSVTPRSLGSVSTSVTLTEFPAVEKDDAPDQSPDDEDADAHQYVVDDSVHGDLPTHRL